MFKDGLISIIEKIFLDGDNRFRKNSSYWTTGLFLIFALIFDGPTRLLKSFRNNFFEVLFFLAFIWFATFATLWLTNKIAVYYKENFKNKKEIRQFCFISILWILAVIAGFAYQHMIEGDRFRDGDFWGLVVFSIYPPLVINGLKLIYDKYFS